MVLIKGQKLMKVYIIIIFIHESLVHLQLQWEDQRLVHFLASIMKSLELN